MNFRFALPGGAATLTSPAASPRSGGAGYADTTRGRATASLLDRCTATNTCPKVIEAFGSTEFWGLRMSPGLIGTDAEADIPLPDNVRRYYYPGTTHGGGRGGFRVDPPAGGALRSAGQSQPRIRHDASTDCRARRLGGQRHRAAAEPVPHAGPWRAERRRCGSSRGVRLLSPAIWRDRRARLALTGAGVVIGFNWFTYIWGVNNGHVVETSLGYYINPLVTVLMGVVILGERLRRWQWAALSIAFVAVLVLTFELGRPPGSRSCWHSASAPTAC